MIKRAIVLLCALMLCLPVFTACGSTAPAMTATPPAATETPVPATPEPTPTATPEPTPEPTADGVYSGDVYEYFARVGFAGGGESDPAIMKWAAPIRIEARGSLTEGDRKALTALADALGEVNGMPRISFVTGGGNFLLYFLPKADASGAVEGYDGSDNSYFTVDWANSPRAAMLITDEMTVQSERDAVLASSFLRALGLRQDADRQYPDSVLNPAAGAAQPSERDMLMLALLYCQELTPGMSKDTAMAAVPTLNPAAAEVKLDRTDVLEYFNEVGFYWADGARDGIVSKWTEPILLEIAGEPGAALRAALDDTVLRLNRTAGFPGISVVESGGNFTLTFAPSGEIRGSYPGMAEGEACAWKPTRSKNGVISKCEIGIAADFADEEQSVSQFLRVFIWALGINFTSDTRQDSILNLAVSALAWSEMDWATVETLYSAGLEPGSKRATAMAALAGN